jgi:serine/threonine-protein kinase
MLTPGTLLAGRYEIIGRIGAGGMSNVYKAKDQKLNRFVAIKVLKPEFSADAKFVKKFRVEAQSAAGLSHPNIVNVYDVGEEDGIYYIVMELVQGITLKHYIERKGKLDIREVLNISVQIASGMGAAHANRIIHRDIKPQNVIMSRDGKVKVTDFGIAKAADSTTVTTNAAGSVHYISPEQARGGYSDEKSDIYSLGITMYEMVTGRVPYDGENNVAVALQHIQGNMISPRELNPDVPRSVEKIILKCTQKKPDLRYGSAKELIMDLRRALAEPDGDYVTLGTAAAMGGAGDSTTVVMDENDVEKLRNASLNKDLDGVRRHERPSSEERRRRQLEEERREYDEYEDHYARKKAKRPAPVVTEEDDEDDDVNPALDKTMMIFGIVGAVIIVIVIFFLIGRAAGLFGGFGSGKKSSTSGETSTNSISTESTLVKVPSCVGLSEEDAIALLEENGLEYKVQEKADSTVEKGYVISMTPNSGTKIEKGTIITLVVSTGKETDEMPDVVNMSLEAAKSQLEGMGLKVTVKNVEDDTIEENHVISSSPVAGKTVKIGATVTLTVSKGRQKVTVPYVINKSYDAAVSALQAEGLNIGDVSYENSDTISYGYIISQGVSANSQVDKGTYVDLVVSIGPKETEPAVGSASVYMPSDNPFGHDIGGQAAYSSGTVMVQIIYSDGTVETLYTAYCSSSSAYESGWSTTVRGEAGTSATVQASVEGTVYSSYSVYFN